MQVHTNSNLKTNRNVQTSEYYKIRALKQSSTNLHSCPTITIWTERMVILRWDPTLQIDQQKQLRGPIVCLICFVLFFLRGA